MPTTTAARATVTAISRTASRAAAAVVLAAAIAILATVAAAGGSGGTRLPKSWKRATIGSGAATLSYPSNWQAIPGDSGTVSFALRGRRGLYLGYLNVTPQQGAEQPAGWAAFRIRRNAGDGDPQVRELSSSEHVAFPHAHGSCVLDSYLSRVGSHPYRELACIVAGKQHTSVFVGAALSNEWVRLAPIVRHAAATLLER